MNKKVTTNVYFGQNHARTLRADANRVMERVAETAVALKQTG